MKLKRYQLKSSENVSIFEFVSNGPNGSIEKVIQFSKTEFDGIYNLGFGDKITDEQDFDDLSVSDNGDWETVLATVVAAVMDFTEKILPP